MKKHLKLRIQGRVQGVFYRASAKEKARELGIVGFVRNEPDGKVYAEVEGEEEVLSLFLDWCKTGPTNANVTAVQTEEGDLHGFSIFEIRRN